MERAKLGYDLPKITLETFVAWKKKKIHDRETKANTETERKKAEFKAGRSVGLSGRDMFTFRPGKLKKILIYLLKDISFKTLLHVLFI